MRSSTKLALPLAAVLFVLLLVPQAALAWEKNCPKEPATNVPIATGDSYIGSNCTLYTAGDVDSFVFSANQGETWNLVLGAVNGKTNDICLTLYDPSFKIIFSGCTSGGDYTVVFDKMLTTAGTYAMDVSEESSGTQEYAISAERLYPLPPNAQPVNLAEIYQGDIGWDTDSNAFTFEGVTTGKYQVSATVNPPKNYDLCMTVYFPGLVYAGSGCTSGGDYTIQIDVTPPGNGTILAFLAAAGWNGTVPSYTFEVSCLAGNCGKVKYPPCTLKDSLSYSANTLTMNFTVGNKYSATWNAWLTYQNTMTSLFSIKQPITVPPVPIQKTYTGLSPEGTVGVLSTLTTATKGITCSSWEEINTGTP